MTMSNRRSDRRMKCPIDTSIDLVMTDRQGIEIDYCPSCRGVWLDRGELDKLVERATFPAPVAPSAYQRRDAERDDDSDGIPYPTNKPRKRRSFLGEMFDF
jgi:Zn-finger nucleic acid-binding protein